MKHFEFNWKQEGETIFAQGWEPNAPQAVICIVHGFNEHSSRYERAASRFTDAGYAVLAFDHFGHGKTTGKRGHVKRYEDFLDSVQRLADEASGRYPNLKLYLWGHSMGGNIVTNYILRRKHAFTGAIITGPLFRLGFEPPALKLFLAKMMVNIYPAFTENAALDSSAISRDADVVRAYNEDPFNHGKITAGTFFGFYQAAQWALEHAQELKTPLLVMHGTADRLTSPEGSKEFASRAPSQLVTLKLWEGFYHELHNEPEPDRTQVINYMLDWLRKTSAL
ncbi:MAG: lysophospholipase [Chitinophagales bacterium]|nr:lysophospholipase [Chitinophagales bacterium]MDW8418412.1 alpha/beta hydrolase [Chitinophagales bacterium]